MMVSGIFICSIFVTNLIGKNEKLSSLEMGGYTGEERFGSVPRSMYSLFELLTLEGWQDVGRPLILAQPLFFLFLFAYIMIFTFGLLNMIVAVVVEKTIVEAKKLEQLGVKEQRLLVAEELARLRTVFECA